MILTPTIFNMLKHALIVALVGGALAFIQAIGADPVITGADPATAGLVGMVLASLTRLVQTEAGKLDPRVAVMVPVPGALPTGQGIGANTTTAPPATTTP